MVQKSVKPAVYINLWVGFVRLYNFMVINVKKDWCNEDRNK